MSAYREPPPEMQVDRDIGETDTALPSSMDLFERATALAGLRRAAQAEQQRLRLELHAVTQEHTRTEAELVETLQRLEAAVREGR